MAASAIPEAVYLLSATWSRELNSNRAIMSLYNGEVNLAELYEDLSMLAGMVETELELGIDGDIVLPMKPV